METFTEPKAFVDNPLFQAQRRKSLADLTGIALDTPIIEIINHFNKLPYCFTLQSCYGHFLHKGQEASHSLASLPAAKPINKVTYRIAYIAFCVENSKPGKRLLSALKEITVIDPENIQFFCAEWFWKRQINSYALQVEPDRFKHEDKAKLDYEEALHIEKIRDKFFDQLVKMLKKQHDINPD